VLNGATTRDHAENIFTPAEVDELKKRERIMIERNTKGYYRSKINDRESMSDSLTTRVSIAAGCQIAGFATFWSTCCTTLGFQIDPYLLSIRRLPHVTQKGHRSYNCDAPIIILHTVPYWVLGMQEQRDAQCIRRVRKSRMRRRR